MIDTRIPSSTTHDPMKPTSRTHNSLQQSETSKRPHDALSRVQTPGQGTPRKQLCFSKHEATQPARHTASRDSSTTHDPMKPTSRPHNRLQQSETSKRPHDALSRVQTPGQGTPRKQLCFQNTRQPSQPGTRQAGTAGKARENSGDFTRSRKTSKRPHDALSRVQTPGQGTPRKQLCFQNTRQPGQPGTRQAGTAGKARENSGDFTRSRITLA
nr:uncharacterized protein LOC113818043 [Penaeus vannamei]